MGSSDQQKMIEILLKVTDINSEKQLKKASKELEQLGLTASDASEVITQSFGTLNKTFSALPKMTSSVRKALLDSFSPNSFIKSNTLVKAGIKDIADVSKRYGVQLDETQLKSLARGAKLIKTHKEQAQLFKQQAKEAKRFKMEYLGIMFAGMQLQRVFGGLFKSMIDQYKQLKDETSPLNQALTRLEANFIFLKYSIVEAMGPLLTTLIDSLVKFVQWLAYMDPSKLQLLVEAIAILAGVGWIMYIGGQFMLGMQALVKVLENMGGAKVLAGIKNLLSLKNLSGLAGLVISVSAVMDFADMFTDEKTSWGDRMLSILKGTAGGALMGFYLGGPAGALIGATIGLGISMTVNAIDWFIEKDKLLNQNDWLEILRKTMNMDAFNWASLALGPAGLVIGFGVEFVMRVNARADKIESNNVAIENAVNDIKDTYGEGASGVLNAIDDDMVKLNETLYDMSTYTSPEILQGLTDAVNNGTVDQLKESFTGEEGLLPEIDKVGEALTNNLVTIPTENMTNYNGTMDSIKLKIDEVNSSIDSIPDHTTKIVEIKYIETGSVV